MAKMKESHDNGALRVGTSSNPFSTGSLFYDERDLTRQSKVDLIKDEEANRYAKAYIADTKSRLEENGRVYSAKPLVDNAGGDIRKARFWLNYSPKDGKQIYGWFNKEQARANSFWRLFWSEGVKVMEKFHVDPFGNPGKCRARIRCRWSVSVDDHYPSERTARRAYELEYSTEIHRFSTAASDLLREIGPRQLPNRSWVSLSQSVIYDDWSIHDMELAAVTLGEEQESIMNLLGKTPRDSWTEEQRKASELLPTINRAKAEILSELTAWKNKARLKVMEEFPEDYSS